MADTNLSAFLNSCCFKILFFTGLNFIVLSLKMDNISELKAKFHKRNITQIVERAKSSAPYLPAFLLLCCLIIYLIATYCGNGSSSSKLKYNSNKFQAIDTEPFNYFTFPESLNSPQNQETKPNSEDSGLLEKDKTQKNKQALRDLDNLLNETIVGILNSLGPHRGPKPPPISRAEALSQEREKLLRYANNLNLKDNDLLSGKPKRNFILTTWRSGSSFLGEAVNSHPSTFYHYEPLLHFEIVQVRSGDLAAEAIRVIQRLLECDYSSLDDYIDYGRSHEFVVSHNPHLWKYCQKTPSLCSDPAFLSGMCTLFPVQILKTVRLRLKLLGPLLHLLNDKFDIKILLLIRDPRAIMQSRKHQSWCGEDKEDCSQPSKLCSDMVDDFHAISELREQYVNQVLALRYEDVSLNPISGVKKVVEFFGLDYTSEVESFVNTHTILTIGGVTSTFRESKKIPFKWIEYFNLHKPDTAELDEIQDEESCRKAMELWRYTRLEINKKNVPRFEAVRQPPPWQDMIVGSDN